MTELIGITIVTLPDGQKVELPDELADKDETLRDSLKMYVPEISNADLKRSVKEGQKHVQVIKKAGTKGNGERKRGSYLEIPFEKLRMDTLIFLLGDYSEIVSSAVECAKTERVSSFKFPAK